MFANKFLLFFTALVLIALAIAIPYLNATTYQSQSNLTSTLSVWGYPLGYGNISSTLTLQYACGSLSSNTYHFSSGYIVDAGTSLYICEQPLLGSTFKNWTCTGPGCASGGYSGTNPSPEVTVNNNMTETANFQTITYTLTTSASPSGGGTTTGSGTYNYGSCGISISEAPTSGYTFTGWSCTGPGCYSGTDLATMICINGTTTETANFQKSSNSYLITTSSNPSAGGSVSGGGTYNYSQYLPITESANMGYAFQNWTCTGSCPSIPPTLNWSFRVTGNAAVTANFNVIAQTNMTQVLFCTISNPQNAGSVYQFENGQDIGMGCHSYPYGTQVGVWATSNYSMGYSLVNFTCNGSGCYTGTSSVSPTITLYDNITETANFKPNSYLTISANPYSQGIVAFGSSANLTSGYNEIASHEFGYGTTVTLYESPKTGSTFTGWTCTGPGCSEGGYTGSNPDPAITIYYGNITETANFNSEASSSGSCQNNLASGSCTGNVAYTQNTTLTGDVYVVGSATINNGATLNMNGYNLNVTVRLNNYGVLNQNGGVIGANPNYYQLNTVANPSNGGTVSGSGKYAYSTSQKISETPNAGYAFAGWSCYGAGCYSGPSSSPSITLNNNITETANFNVIAQTNMTQVLFCTISNPQNAGSVYQFENGQDIGMGCHSYPYGTQVGVWATSNYSMGYSLVNFTCNGSGCYTGTSSVSPTITLYDNITETANFKPNSYLTISANPYSQGIVAFGSSANLTSGYNEIASHEFGYGTTVTLYESPKTGSTFTGWTCTGPGCSEGGYTGSNPDHAITIYGNITETANFKQNQTSTNVESAQAINITNRPQRQITNVGVLTNSGTRQVSINSSPSTGTYTITSGNVEATSALNITVTDNSLKAGNATITIVPSEAVSILEANVANTNVTISHIDLENNQTLTGYSIQGQVSAKILFLLPVQYTVNATVNAQTGQVISVQKPWWAFLTTK